MKIFILCALPALIIWILIWYYSHNIKNPIDRIWRLIGYVISIMPFINLIASIVLTIILFVAILNGDKFELKDTKFNRWLFESKAKEWDSKL